MKREIVIIGLILIFSSLFWSCEKDEICIEEITPLLIIRFYDNDFPDDFKKVANLKVQIDGISGDYTNETISFFTDSIAIPIKVTENFTKIKLILNGSDNDLDNDNEDQIDLNYTREDEFVSRSCGYKTLFYDVSTSLIKDNDNWIKKLEIAGLLPLNIVNQQNAHVKIYH